MPAILNCGARTRASCAGDSLRRLLQCGVFATLLSGGEGMAQTNSAALEQLRTEVRGKGWIGFGARSNTGDWDLFACRPDGSDRLQITQTPELNEFAPVWSRDARRLIYRRVPRAEVIDNNRHGEQGELVLANAGGTAPVVLGKQIPWASFSPDGTQLASLSIKGISIYDLATRKVLRTLP